jgi:acid phosphatase type 7
VRRRTKLTLGVAGFITVLVTAGLVTRSFSSPVAAAPPVVIVAAGDIACDPAYPDFNTGIGTAVGCHEKATSDLVETIKPDAVLALGDIQYVHGTAANYAASYDPTWGRFKDITHPVLGNHEGGEGGTNTTYFDYFGQSAGDRTQGYYSFDLGAWHLIALNSNCGTYSFNHSHDDCAAGSAQDTWLKNDLATHPAMCTLTYFHVPRFSSGSDHRSDATSDNTLTTLWADLYSAGADVILNGHAHEYERFAPLTPAGQIDQARGIREFIVGTGGDDHHTAGAAVHGSEVRSSDSFGVLRLTLRSSSYDYQFVNDRTPGATNTDHGSAQCHH